MGILVSHQSVALINFYFREHLFEFK